MEIGVFIPIGSNGWLVSTTSPQYRPSFELNRQVTLNAERYGFDFVLLFDETPLVVKRVVVVWVVGFHLEIVVPSSSSRSKSASHQTTLLFELGD